MQPNFLYPMQAMTWNFYLANVVDGMDEAKFVCNIVNVVILQSMKEFAWMEDILARK